MFSWATRAVFVFPPLASPTYVPLGLASLAPFIRREAPRCSLRILDLNIEAWSTLCEEHDEGRVLLDFARGRSGDFYDPLAYAAKQQVWEEVAQRLRRLGVLCGEFASAPEPTAEADPEVSCLLTRQVEQVLATDPQLVGISTVFPEQLGFALALARAIKHAGGRAGSGAPRIILGGASLSALRVDELLARCPFVDAVLLGEGELGAARLCAGDDDTAVPGLVHRRPGGLCHNRRAGSTRLDLLPPADFSDFDLDAYLNGRPVLPLLFSRGCRWRRCRFCAHNFSFAGYRAKAAETFAEELDLAARRHGAEHFYLADQYVDAAGLRALVETLERRGPRCVFHVMGRPTADYTPELLGRAFAVGCRWISWGVESGSQRLIDLVDKGTRVETMKRVLRDAHEAGISNLVMLIFGLPSSTDLDLAHTLRLVEEVYGSVDAFTASSFVLFAGTAFARQPETYGLHVTGPREVLGQGETAVHSIRLGYQEVAADESLRPPRASLEIAAFERRRAWLGEPSFMDRLCAEHYLLYAAHRASGGARRDASPC
jgi:hypothetical protein